MQDMLDWRLAGRWESSIVWWFRCFLFGTSCLNWGAKGAPLPRLYGSALCASVFGGGGRWACGAL